MVSYICLYIEVPAKEEQIDKGADNGLMNLFVFGKADGFTAESFDACTQSQMIPFDFLCILFPADKLVCGNPFFIGKVMIRINLSDRKRLSITVVKTSNSLS